MEQPVLQTARLLLRPFALSDAFDLQRLAGAPEVADTTLNMPHPYEDGMAEQWISSQPALFDAGEAVRSAVTLLDSKELIGGVGLGVTPRHRRAELAYWLGVPFWSQGYMTEAAGALMRYGFAEMGLHKITASHFARNPASGRVMQKLGMTQEGLLRREARKGDRFEDMVVYGLLADEWRAGRWRA